MLIMKNIKNLPSKVCSYKNKFVDLLMFNSKTNKMEALKQKLQDLQEALKNKSISVNEYSSMYHATYQQLKKLQND